MVNIRTGAYSLDSGVLEGIFQDISIFYIFFFLSHVVVRVEVILHLVFHGLIKFTLLVNKL